MFDKLLKTIVARPVADFAPGPVQLADGLWVLDRRVAFVGGAQMPVRSTLVRLEDGSLVVISAPPIREDDVARVGELGVVRAVIAPNSYHYLFARPCCEAFPEATLYAAPGLAERVPAMEGAVELGEETPSPWPGELEHLVVRAAARTAEVVFYHAPSATLVVTDLVFNLPRPDAWRDRLMCRLNGAVKGLGPGRTARKLLLSDAEAVARFLDALESWPVERIVIGHGEALEDDAKSRLEAALRPYAGG